MESQAARRTSARERLLAAADELFYENGINLVGIDRVIAHAGVAKASLYDCFGSKEELIRAYLKGRAEKRKARIVERLAGLETPREKILGVFDLLAEIVSRTDYRGCAFQRTSAEAGTSSVIKGTCDEPRAWLRSQFTELARQAKAADPELLGRQLVFLYDGASLAASVDGDRNAPKAARTLAEQMLPLPKPAPSKGRGRNA
jgi:AcrR family transcriptional regulator